MHRGATLREIAARAGVTPAAASRALKDAADIGEETKRRVRRIAAELDYRPNEVARSLRECRTRTIGLSVFHLDNPHFGRLALAVQRRIEAQGFATLLAPAEAPLRDAVELLRWRCVDGMIVTANLLTEQDINLWQRCRNSAPFVVLGNASGLPVDSVTTDREAGTRDAIRALIALGHRDIGYLPMPSGPHAGDRGTRVAGFRQAMAEADLPIREEWMFVAPRDMEGARNAALAVLSRPRRPTALFCHSDLCAWGVLRAAKELGLNVPRDLSIVGFDNTEMAAYGLLALTTVDQPAPLVAETAVSLLLERIAHPDAPPRQVVLEARLIVRESTGPAPNRPRRAGNRQDRKPRPSPRALTP
ncbi:MAG TPA: LacI family DNA-binding transcriptional regulator [Candidatus Brocadiia bacterium]|nr:LacI family DNA-binding transcriptional regulator [Candidatus Brocadiia bacterium]